MWTDSPLADSLFLTRTKKFADSLFLTNCFIQGVAVEPFWFYCR